MSVAMFEIARPTADPHAFILMAVLTVYSAITQPALAYVGVRASVRTDAVLNEELRLIREELQILRGLEKELGVRE